MCVCVCVSAACKPKDYKFMKVYCALIVSHPDIYLVNAGDERNEFIPSIHECEKSLL